MSVLDNERVNEFENDVTNEEDFKELYDKYVEFERQQSQDINTRLEVRSVTQQIFETVKENNDYKNSKDKFSTNKGSVWKNPWVIDTCLIIGDSTILGLEEHRMGGKFKVRSHSGAIIADLYHHIIPMGPKNPRYIIIMIWTNDAINKTADGMISKIKDLYLT